MKLLADTSALLALVLRSDRNHDLAVRFLRRNQGTRFVVTDLILSEVVTRLRARADGRAAAALGRDLLRSRRYELVFVDADLADGALDRLEQFADKRLSFTDCVSFAVMRQRQLTDALTADRHFEQAGFRILLLGEGREA